MAAIKDYTPVTYASGIVGNTLREHIHLITTSELMQP
jgi:hypothetical protein